ncbi:hypothetical protein R1flu_004809 [Riccia fluitans]|uniref:Uncharacterized protein n=1 Tax=Riccia fluitans TaxID=41844 RepID=A0ABD1YRQ4_9MARC
MNKLVVKGWDPDNHFDKCYLENRRKLLAYGEVMASNSKRKNSRIRPCFSEKAVVVNTSNFSTLRELLASRSPMVFENSSVREYEKVRYFSIEEDEDQKQFQLKAAGYIAYCRERALEETAKMENISRFGVSALPDEVVPSKSKSAPTDSAPSCTALVPVTKDKEKSQGRIKRKLAQAAAKVKMIGGAALASAKLVRSEFRKGFRDR